MPYHIYRQIPRLCCREGKKSSLRRVRVILMPAFRVNKNVTPSVAKNPFSSLRKQEGYDLMISLMIEGGELVDLHMTQAQAITLIRLIQSYIEPQQE